MLELVLKWCYHARVCVFCSAQSLSSISHRSNRHLHPVGFQPLWRCSGTGGFMLWMLPLEQLRGPCCNSSFLLLTSVSAESLPGAAWQRLSWKRRDLSQLFLVMPDVIFSPGLYFTYLHIKREIFYRTLEEFLKHSLNVCLHKPPYFKVLPGDMLIAQLGQILYSWNSSCVVNLQVAWTWKMDGQSSDLKIPYILWIQASGGFKSQLKL